MSFRLTDADLSFDSDDSSYMDAEMEPQQQHQQAPPASNLLDSLAALRAAGMMSDEQYLRLIGTLNPGSGTTTTAANDIEDHRIQLCLATLTTFQGDKDDFHMAHRWILAVEHDLRAIGLQQHQWSLACFRKMLLDSPASLWVESIYGNGGTVAAPDWETWKTSFLDQFLNPNELQAAQSAFNIVCMNSRGTDVLVFNEAFRAAAVRLNFAYKANELVQCPFMLTRSLISTLRPTASAHARVVHRSS